MSRHYFVILGAALIVSGLCANVQAELLFSDSYDTDSPNADINYQIDNRTGGTYGGAGSATYNLYQDTNTTLMVGQVESGKKTLLLDAGTSILRVFTWLDHNFNGSDSDGGLDLDFTVKSTAPATDTAWFCVSIGSSTSSVSGLSHRPLDNGVALYFRGNGELNVRVNGSTKETSTWISGGNDLAYHTFRFEMRGVGDDNPFDGTGDMNLKVYMDNGATPIVDYTSSDAITDNYIGIDQAYDVDPGAQAYYDGISVSNFAVPEPSALALLTAGLAGLLAYAWRKRK